MSGPVAAGGAGAAKQLRFLQFEVTGKVQGVFFRKYTVAEAKRLGLVGWCKNHADGQRVVGEAEGAPEQIDAFRTWLAHTGSPKSVIEKTSFEEKPLDSVTFVDFLVRK